MSNIKLVIIVEGGVVQDIYTSDKKAFGEVRVMDLDYLKEQGICRDKREAIAQAAIEGMEDIF